MIAASHTFVKCLSSCKAVPEQIAKCMCDHHSQIKSSDWIRISLFITSVVLLFSANNIIATLMILLWLYFRTTILCFNMEWEINTSEITLFNCWHPQGWLALISVNQKCFTWLALELNFPASLFSCVSAERSAIQTAGARGTPNVYQLIRPKRVVQ